jgi:hypothetical protein
MQRTNHDGFPYVQPHREANGLARGRARFSDPLQFDQNIVRSLPPVFRRAATLAALLFSACFAPTLNHFLEQWKLLVVTRDCAQRGGGYVDSNHCRGGRQRGR